MKIEKRFNELMSFAASEATFAFSKLLSQQMTLASADVSVNVSEVQSSIKESIKEEVAQISPDMGGAVIMTTPLLGTLEGFGSYILPGTSALRICDVLLHRKLGSTLQLGSLEESALLETGNIIVGCFLNALGYVSVLDNILHKKMTLTVSTKSEIPNLSYISSNGEYRVRISFYMKHIVQDERQRIDIDGICVFFFDSAKVTALLNRPRNPEKSF
ncbi:Chemotaxis protein CheC, inhibitor of MCP methylation [Legionella steigerwaltii]|uniref:Chemotaxis protein CheC, inhibitor of MCP methylation n=1 Tax=Legionella steigerwaltii TaxID=460 RepID=A0A378LDA5_9GAMM|nr:hypothetical protein [Legionella steigerwaltii]KTD71684.1 hypothetical protein Lstg_2892 [Legionella steigerwaltii]STY23852.1 Chemotaxis protein CheC, inhibitor of MCP methylation [Legionella steigerwaltii]